MAIRPENCILDVNTQKGDIMHYLKKIIKIAVLLAFPIYFYMIFSPKEKVQELNLFISTEIDTTKQVFLISIEDSTNSFIVQDRFVLKKDEEYGTSIEFNNMKDTLYLLTKFRGNEKVHEFIINSSVDNELEISNKNEVEFLTDDITKALKKYNDENTKNIFLVILYVWLLFIVLYIRSRKYT